jgi:hypothetical protein
MDILNALAVIGIWLAIAVGLAAVPVGTVYVIGRVFERGRETGAFYSLNQRAAVIAGIVLGLVVVWVNFRLVDQTLNEVLEVGGRWDLTLSRFVVDKANPLKLTARPLVEYLTTADGRRNLAVILALPAAFILLVGGGLVLGWRRARHLDAPLDGLAIFLLTTYATVYVAAAALWLVNILNFWLLGLALWLLQRWRYAPHASSHGASHRDAH